MQLNRPALAFALAAAATLSALPATAHCQAITGELTRIVAPTLIVSGDKDRPIAPTRARAVHERIAGQALWPLSKLDVR